MLSRVAVIMSVYKSDSPKNLSLAIDSIVNQSYECIDFFISVDGVVPDSIYDILHFYESIKNITVFYDKVNRGLAFRLNNMIDFILSSSCDYEFIARMDADDISNSDRIHRQVEYLMNNLDVSVVGSDVQEIDSLGNHIFYKRMDNDHDLISKNIIKKCPFNHPSVMFRANVFEKGYRYNSDLKNTQDYYLWVDLLSAGMIFSNINEPLLKFRIDDNFHSRRGIQKAMNDLRSRIYAFRKLDVLSFGNVVHTLALFSLRLCPPFVKRFAYKYFR